MKGYSALSENGMRIFAEHVLPKMAKAAQSHKYDYLNTWGDAFVIASTNVKAITNIALDFRDLFRNCDWKELSISPLTVRIALHTGEIHWGNDIFFERGMIAGAAVNLAARIEPIVEPGEIWAFGSITFMRTGHREKQPMAILRKTMPSSGSFPGKRSVGFAPTSIRKSENCLKP